MIEMKSASYYPNYNKTDVDIAIRLINAYNVTKREDKGQFEKLVPNDLWTKISNEPLIQKLINILDNGDAISLSIFLNEFGTSNTWYGGIHLCGISPETPHNYGDSVFRDLEILCSHLKIEIKNEHTVDDIIKNLSDYFGTSVIIPPVIPIAGLASSFGILNRKNINQLYLSNTVKNLTNPNDNICEYGGGLGLNAYYLYNMNRKNVYLFDLPFVNVISGYFLIKALGHNAVILDGERCRSESINISAFWNCEHFAKDHFEIAVNQDSFPEIDLNILLQYFKTIEFNTKSYFLSINHEDTRNYDHCIIPMLLTHFAYFNRVKREKALLNVGEASYMYYEELYTINKS
jgi:hypothetical protein